VATPDVVLAALGIAPTSVVCDVGAGTGYFALRLAKLAAQVYAVDVEPQLLVLLRDRVASAGLQNVTPVLGLPHDPLVPAAACDFVLVVNVFHHVPEKAAYLRRLQAALRPGAGWPSSTSTSASCRWVRLWTTSSPARTAWSRSARRDCRW